MPVRVRGCRGRGALGAQCGHGVVGVTDFVRGALPQREPGLGRGQRPCVVPGPGPVGCGSSVEQQGGSVDLVLGEGEPVSGGRADDQVGAQLGPRPGHKDLQRLSRPLRQLVRPQPFHQPLGAAAGAQGAREQREKPSEPGRGDLLSATGDTRQQGQVYGHLCRLAKVRPPERLPRAELPAVQWRQLRFGGLAGGEGCPGCTRASATPRPLPPCLPPGPDGMLHLPYKSRVFVSPSPVASMRRPHGRPMPGAGGDGLGAVCGRTSCSTVRTAPVRSGGDRPGVGAPRSARRRRGPTAARHRPVRAEGVPDENVGPPPPPPRGARAPRPLRSAHPMCTPTPVSVDDRYGRRPRRHVERCDDLDRRGQ